MSSSKVRTVAARDLAGALLDDHVLVESGDAGVYAPMFGVSESRLRDELLYLRFVLVNLIVSSTLGPTPSAKALHNALDRCASERLGEAHALECNRRIPRYVEAVNNRSPGEHPCAPLKGVLLEFCGHEPDPNLDSFLDMLVDGQFMQMLTPIESQLKSVKVV